MNQSGMVSLPDESARSSQFFDWVATFIPQRGEEGTRCFDAAHDMPPISANSLANLNIGCIINSFRARRDMNFELDPHFRPSVNCEQAQVEQRCRQAQDYWWALETELEIYAFLLSRNSEFDFRWTPLWLEEFRKRQKRVPKAFEAIQNILLAMVPPNEQPEVQEMFDVSFIIKQIERGLLDLASLAKWLSAVLKTYCAPPRDSWVDQICRQLGLGMQDFNARIVVTGLRMLFGLFEAMKLDVVNHQLRHLRPTLLSTTLHFEHVCYERGIAAGLVNTHYSLQWYNQPMEDRFVGISANGPLFRLTRCLVRTLLAGTVPSDPMKWPLPQTFNLDKERLSHIRNLMLSIVDEDIYVFRLLGMMRRLRRSECDMRVAVEHLRQILPIISRDSSLDESVRHVAVELVRIAITNATVPASRQSSNGGDIQHTPAPPTFDWHGLYTETEAWVHGLIHGDFNVYRLHLDTVELNLVQRIFSLMILYAEMDSTQLWQTLVAQPNLPLSLPGYSFHRSPRFELVCRKLTHIALTHWRVWGPILYLAPVANGTAAPL